MTMLPRVVLCVDLPASQIDTLIYLLYTIWARHFFVAVSDRPWVASSLVLA